MKKNYITSKNECELKSKIEYLKTNYKTLYKELYPIWFVNSNKIRVGYGRAMTYWELDFENHGEITARRCMTFNDWFLILSLVGIDVIFVYLLIYGGITVVDICMLLGLVLLEVLPLYYLYVISPLKKITRFVEKYLS